MTLDRINAPSFIDLEPFTLVKPDKLNEASGLTAFILEQGQQEVCRLEITFPAGKWYEPYTGVSYFTSKLLAEGTQKHSSGELQQIIAQYGSFFEVNPGNDQVTLSIFCLSRYLKPMLTLLEEMIEQPLLDAEELDKLKSQARQNYALNLNKTSYLAGRAYIHLLFGNDHPYGRVLDDQAIEKVTLEDIKKFHQHAFHWNQASVFISGKGENLNAFIQDWMKSKNIPGPLKGSLSFNSPRPVGQKIKVEKEGAVQSSVKAGFFIPSRYEESFPAIYMYNEIFGGYFGSRLMQNIREDKGFTYGIHSSMVQDIHTSYWSVQTDVNGDNAEATVREIKFEMQRMQDELVSEDELKVVKNYIIGSFISSLDTPFSFMDRFKATYFNELGDDYYERLMKKLLAVTTQQIQDVAKKYFDPEQLNVVVAGK
ncbi:MAG: zinc protease [Cytophagaceae bacterium]|jgi:predicted Zn-dependent peptidase|nr:zinc protease [Cytophagaceae bacterium]